MLLSRWVRTSKPFDDFVERAAAARIEQATTGVELGKKDFISWLTNNSNLEEDISMDELKEEVILLITAGKRWLPSTCTQEQPELTLT